MRMHSSRRAPTCLLALVLIQGLQAAPAAAVGFGGFFEYGRSFTGSGGDLGSAAPSLGFPLSTFDRNEFGVGLSLDTNLARNRLFNYRLDLGFHVVEWANSDVDPNGYGFMWNNAFGFGVFRSERFRLWIGPAARMNFDYFSYSDSSNPTSDIADVQVGIGPEIGFNVHLGRHFTSTLSVAYNYKWGWYFFPYSDLATDLSLSHTDNYVGVNLAFFFRTSGDQY